jgi:uncharacterized protein (DUF2461 family)
VPHGAAVRLAGERQDSVQTQQGIWFGETALYVQLDAAGLILAGGYWSTEAAQVARLRRAIADDVAGPELARALVAVRRAKFDVGGARVTRVPAGYPKDHPRAELLLHKSLTAHRSYGAPAWLGTKRAKTEIAKAWRSLAPLTSWLDTHVGRE